MKGDKTILNEDDKLSFDNEMSELLADQILFSESVFSRLPMGIEIYDTHGILRGLNKRAEVIYGVDRDSVMNKINLFDSPYLDADLEARIKSGDDNILLEFEYDFDRINKEYFTSSNKNTMIYEVNVIAIRNKKGEIVGHMLLTNDVTSERDDKFHTEENKKNLEMSMEAANMSSWAYDVRKKVFNPLYGQPLASANMTMDDVLEILHPQDHDTLARLFEQLVNKEISRGQMTLRFYDAQSSSYRYYESRMRLSTEHRGKMLIIGTQLDVTEKVQMSKKTQDLIAKRELAMKINDIVHWDFDVKIRKFESYNDPVNDYASDKPITTDEYMEVIHPEDRSWANDALQAMISGEKNNINFTCRMQTKHDDSWQYWNITGVPFEYGENGEVVRYTGFRQNISKLHQLNEEIKERNYKMELTFKTIGMSYWDFDVSTGQYRAFNDPVNDFDSAKTILPEDYLNAAHPDDTAKVRENINRMLSGTCQEFNLPYRSRTKWDQEWQTLIVTGLPSEKDKKGNITRYTGIAFNNTKWEKMAQELKEMKEKAELSDRLKSAFLANMSHEIRTPLNAIVGFSELLVNCDDPAEKAEYMAVIDSNNELLLHLINDILDLSKIESGVLERNCQTFNLAQVCDELYTMMLLRITNPEVELLMNSHPDCLVLLDEKRIRQVWMNFLTNAVKHTRSGHIKMGYDVEKDGIRIYVEDTGTGIAEAQHDKIFGRFQKLDEFAQGTGLGLAISKAIIEAAGGEIGFTSKPGAGSTFWAKIPCKTDITVVTESPKQSASDSFQALDTTTTGKETKILVAEDNDSNYSLVRHILKDYDITRAKNGVEAVDKVLNGKYNIVLMDLKMPIMGGLEATRKIREFDAKIPIIALTANAFDSDKVSATEAGCNAFLTKPVKKNQLLELFSTKW